MEIETITAPPAADTGATSQPKPEETPKQPDTGAQKEAERKWKLKYGKTEREVTEKELIAEAQKGWASDEKFKSAAQKEREIQKALENGDLDYLIKKMKGKDKVEFAKEILKAELKRKTMSPEELEAEEHKSELEKLRKERADFEAQKEKEKMEAAQRHYEEQWDKELAAAITKHGLPKNKYVIGRAVKIASEVLDLTGNDPDWDLVVGEAKRQTQEELMELVGQLEDFGFMGEDLPRKISKWLVNKGMSKPAADKEAAKVVKQSSEQKPDIQTVDAEEYWAKKREQWSK